MDSYAGDSGGSPGTGGCARFPSRHKATPSVQTRCSTKCDLPPETPWLDAAGLEPQRRSWADLPVDILGIVAARLPRSDDRAAFRSVCHAWRAAARLHRLPPPPLPLLVLADFSFATFCADGAVAGTRRIPLPFVKEAAADDVRCVGSFDSWLVGVQLHKGRYFGDGRCFLMNAFSRAVVLLPPQCISTHFIDAYSRSLPIVNGSGAVHCTVNAARYVMSFSKVLLSASPDSRSVCVVAALSVPRSIARLALWRPGMTSWCVCHGGCISKFSDIALYQGKLYMFSRLTTNLFVFEISEDDSGLMVSRVERCVTLLPEVDSEYRQRWNIVEWHEKLLLVVTYLGAAEGWGSISRIGVFEVDLSTNPIRFTEINSLDGDCIFISPCSSKSFRACQYDEVDGDRIYFIDGSLNPANHAPPFDKFVYNIREGTIRPFAAEIPEDKLRAPHGMLMNPTWLFPSE